MERKKAPNPSPSPIKIVTALTLDQAVRILSVAVERPQVRRPATA